MYELRQKSNWLIAVGVLAVLVPLGTVWIPEVRHYYVRVEPVSEAEALAFLAEMSPEVCNQFARFDLSDTWGVAPHDLKVAREAALHSQLLVPNRPVELLDSTRSRLPALHDRSKPMSLGVAMLLVPQLLVGEYEETGNVAALRAAQSYLRDWWKLEKRTIAPSGLQWNDHAIAGRVFPLTRYLCAASQRKELSPEEASDIVSALLTSGNRLSKPGFFTFRTNHGIMQNLALMHLAAMFPSYHRAREYADVAVARIVDQLEFYVSEEGVVLEHSSGYDAFGVHLLSIAALYLQQLEVAIPERLSRAYPGAVRFLAQLRRPDGTVPAWGNTHSRSGLPLVARDKSLAQHVQLSQDDGECALPATHEALVSGVAIWWDRSAGTDCGESRLQQALIVWSNFPSEAHKHVDEMSVYLWMRGFNLVTSTGYWPYDAPHYRDAVGWTSGNGPRFVGENAALRGETTPVRKASIEAAEFLELTRDAGPGGKLRRQILYVRPDVWLLVDSDESAPGPRGRDFEVEFTFDPTLAVKPTAPLGYALMSGNQSVARVHLAGCEGGRVDVRRGSTEPFVGWTAARGSVEPAYALTRRCPAGGVSFIRIDAREQTSVAPTRELASGVAEAWSQQWGDTSIERTGDELMIRSHAKQDAVATVRLSPIEGYSEAKRKLDDAFYLADSKYERYEENWRGSRTKVTYAILGAFVLQATLMVALYVFARLRAPLRGVLFNVGGAFAVAWVALAVWLWSVYFT